jgi:hypothetical protein
VDRTQVGRAATRKGRARTRKKRAMTLFRPAGIQISSLLRRMV